MATPHPLSGITKFRPGSNIHFEEKIGKVLFVGDVRVTEETLIAGDIFIFDFKHLTAAHCLKFINPVVRKALTVAHVAYPQRAKCVHFVNTPPAAEKLISVIKSFVKEKIANRVSIH